MKRILLLAVFVTQCSRPALPQQKSGPSDNSSVDALTHALYQVISGPAGGRDWPRFRSLFTEGARLIPMRTSAEGSAPAVLTVEDYISRAGANFEKQAFYESEVSRRVETFGSIAHVFSTYESRHAPQDKPFARGINSIQMVNDRGKWKVITILWDAEKPGTPIPEKYLN